LLKPSYNESPQHFFLIKDIEAYINKFTNKVQTFNTAKPDIVFEVDKKKYAVEIETGKVLKTNKRKFLAKVKALKKDYGKNWFFVVTDKNLYRNYKKFGPTFTKRSISTKIWGIFKNDT
jgi:hypothetical protein